MDDLGEIRSLRDALAHISSWVVQVRALVDEVYRLRDRVAALERVAMAARLVSEEWDDVARFPLIFAARIDSLRTALTTLEESQR